jgi:hypothetical protein
MQLERAPVRIGAAATARRARASSGLMPGTLSHHDLDNISVIAYNSGVALRVPAHVGTRAAARRLRELHASPGSP